ncbi:hypothetical protein I3760_04G191600 [Carya illinoinensis]|nr:hypothetical protein I3760_04G191600 [Carya illinoinensis]
MRLLFPLIACLLLLLPHSLSYNYLLPLCRQEERIALMQMKDSFIIKNYFDCEYTEWNYPKVASWRMDRNNTNCCVWDGVECNQDTGHVIALNLSRSCLYGSITSKSSLFRLHHLQNLTLAGNDFNHSQIPYEIGNLSSLIHLDLSYSNFLGQIPSQIQYLSKLSFLSLSTLLFQLPHLQVLYVSYNEDLTGHLPEFHTNSPLEYLFLDDTNFSGDLPSSIGNLNSLIRFDIFNSYLNLTKFPNILQNQSRLRHLDLEGNNLQGLIPKWMYNASKESLQYFLLYNNFLTGIENSPTIIPWPNLEYSLLDDNMMNGSLPIPPPSLIYYFVRNNSFTGRISPFICNMSSPVLLGLSYNYLSGTIHPCLGNLNQTSLSVLALRRNNLGGTIPKTWAKGCLLRMLDLSQNQLQGHLPRSLANCTKLEYLHVGHNQMNDNYPFWLGTLQQLKILVFHSNGLSSLEKWGIALSQVFTLIAAIDEDVFEVDHHKLPNERLEDLVHNAHESARRVREAKWHD